MPPIHLEDSVAATHNKQYQMAGIARPTEEAVNGYNFLSTATATRVILVIICWNCSGESC